jgi:predicted esterase
VRQTLSFCLFSAWIFTGCVHGLYWRQTGPEIISERFSTTKDRAFDYWLLTYRESEQKRLPLIFVLHGTGGNGEDYLAVWKEEASKRRFMVLSPTRSDVLRTQIATLTDLRELLSQIEKKYPVDLGRVYLVGVSSGALSAWRLYSQSPEKWAGMILISAPNRDKWMKGMEGKAYPPVLFVHGKKDEQFDFNETVKNADFMKSLGFNVTLLDWPEGRHEHRPEWNAAIFDWMEKVKS